MKGRFPTNAPSSFCSPAPGLHVVPSRTAPGVCSILRLLSSQLNAALATHPPLQPNGAVPVATCGTIAPCTERQALLLAQASAPREQACAKGRARRWGTLAMSGKALPCALGSQLQTPSWDSASLSGPAAAMPAAHDPCGDSIDDCQPSHRPLKLPKFSHHGNRSAAAKTLSCRTSPADFPLGNSVLHDSSILASRKSPPHPLMLSLMMRVVFLLCQAKCLEPPKGSSLAAKFMLLIPGDVASHLCLQASAHPQEPLQACCMAMVGKVLRMFLLPLLRLLFATTILCNMIRQSLAILCISAPQLKHLVAPLPLSKA